MTQDDLPAGTGAVMCPRAPNPVVAFAVSISLLVTAWAPRSLAQAPVGTGPAASQLPSEQRPRAPSERVLPAPEFVEPGEAPLQLPAITPAPGETAAPGLEVFVRKIQVVGNTVFSGEELAEVTSGYENRTITIAELEELRYNLTVFYVSRGYINSGAVIPDQQIEDGIIRLRIIEGRLSGIQVTGTQHLRSDYVSRRLELGAGPPLNVNTMQERLQLLLESPVIARINSELGPGDRPGEATLLARVDEGRPYDLAFTLDNNLSPAAGDVEGFIEGSWYSPLGQGDSLTGSYGMAEGQDSVYVNYALPVNRHDTTVEGFYYYQDGDVVEDPFDTLDIENEQETYGVRVTHPFMHRPNESVSAAIGLERRSSETRFLDNEPFPIYPKYDLTVFRFSQNWLRRGRNQVLAARSTFSLGSDGLGASINNSDEQLVDDTGFFAWLGQFQWARRFEADGGELVFRLDGQWTRDALLPIEQFRVGGPLSVRGYRVNQLVRDKGYSTSLEYRYPVIRDASGRNTVQAAVFTDAGGAWFNDIDSPNPENIASAGVGLRWNVHPVVSGAVYWGYQLKDIDNRPDDSLQDKGWSFFLNLDLAGISDALKSRRKTGRSPVSVSP